MAEKKSIAPKKSASASVAVPAKAEAKPAIKAPAASSGATATKAAPAPAAPAPAAPSAKPAAIKPANMVKPVSAGDRARMVAEAAYFIAEKRGFTPGRAEQDWAVAERQVAALLSRL